jgi:membrane protease YdiL (CAAX protease family)
MPSPENIAVLRDVLVMAMLALGLALLLYAGVRMVFDASWNLEGNVLTRPYGAPDALAALLLLAVLCGGFFAREKAGPTPADVTTSGVTLEGLLMNVIFMLLLCAVILGHLIVVRRLNPAEMFGLRQMSLKRALRFAVIALLFTVAGGAIVMLALMGLNEGPLPGGSAPQDAVKSFEDGGNLAYRLALAFVAVVTAPVTEELLFRGFLYGVVKRMTDRWFAAVFTSVIFAVVHLHVGTAPQLFLLGIGLAIAYEQSGCLLVPIFMHAMFNACNIAMLAYAAYTI